MFKGLDIFHGNKGNLLQNPLLIPKQGEAQKEVRTEVPAIPAAVQTKNIPNEKTYDKANDLVNISKAKIQVKCQ